jgi:hypothetical protein
MLFAVYEITSVVLTTVHHVPAHCGTVLRRPLCSWALPLLSTGPQPLDPPRPDRGVQWSDACVFSLLEQNPPPPTS